MPTSEPTELLSCCWQACCAATVLAPCMQLENCVSCGQNIAKPASTNALNTAPTAPRTVAKTAPRGRPLPSRRARDMAETDSHSASSAMISASATTNTPRRTFPDIIIMPTRLRIASITAAQERCCSAGSAGGRGCRARGGYTGGRWGVCCRSANLAIAVHFAVPARVTAMNARLVVLVSGEGTNLQALIDACADPGYGASIAAVGADRGDVGALD